MPSVLAVIPVYNHASGIGAVIDGCLEHIDRDHVLVVDDGSTDFSAAVAGSRLVHIRRHERNMGKGRALITGFNYAILRDVEWVLTLDADGQHLPGEIPLFLKAAEADRYDIIIGSRARLFTKMPIPRIFSNTVTSKVLSYFTGQKIEDSQCGYRIIKTDLLRKMVFKTSDYLLETEILLLAAQLGARIGFVPVTTRYAGEKSHMNNMRAISRFVTTVWMNRKQFMHKVK